MPEQNEVYADRRKKKRLRGALGTLKDRARELKNAAQRAALAIATIGLLNAPGVLPKAEAADIPQRPNIVFVLADDMGYGDAGCYGQQQIQTPSIDALAAQGLRFTNFYAGAPSCSPSRCCLMTGMHLGHCSVVENAMPNDPMRREDISVAQILDRAGYRSHFVGKWGLGGATPSSDWAPWAPEGNTWEGELIPRHTHTLPTRKGFDSSLAYLEQASAHLYLPTHLWDDETRLDFPENQAWPHDPYGDYLKRPVYSHDLFTSRALEILREADNTQPFYLQLSYTTPHRENMIPPDYNPYASTGWPEGEQAYAAMISLMDRDLGRVVDAIRANTDIASNTLVIFSSDNGPQETGGPPDAHSAEFFDSNGDLRDIKFTLYEGGIREPCVMWWPGVIAPGRVSDLRAGFFDFLPTAAELAGLPAPSGIDGLSIVPTITGEGEQETHSFMLFENGGDYAVRKGNWKYLRFQTGVQELYNLATDLSETTNLAAANPAIVADMEAILAAEATGPPAAADPVLEVVGDVSPEAPVTEYPAARDGATSDTVCWWRFDNDGKTAGQKADICRNEATGDTEKATAHFDPVYLTTGAPGSVPLTRETNSLALALDGTSQCLTLDDTEGRLTINRASFTVEAWVRLYRTATGLSGTDRQWLVYHKPLGTSDTRINYAFLVQMGDLGALPDSSGKTEDLTGRELGFAFGNKSRTWVVTSNLEITDYNWHYVRGVYNREKETATFQLDTVSETLPINSKGTIIAASGLFMVGGHHNAAGAFNQLLDGEIDEVRVSRGVLSPRNLLHQSPLPMVRHYLCDFGKVPRGTTPVTRSFRVLNTAPGYPRVMRGSVGATGLTDPRLACTGGMFDHLVDGAPSTTYTVTLTPEALGTLAGQTITVRAQTTAFENPVQNTPVSVNIIGEVVDQKSAQMTLW